MPEYNLLKEKWVPCLNNKGVKELYSLQDAIVHAREIREIYDNSPLVTVALHRLILAILHRVFGPEDAMAWACLWHGKRFDATKIEVYFDKYQDRFNLFDSKQPFYQVASMSFADYGGHHSKLVQEKSTGNNATLFDHTSEQIETALMPDEAARQLVAHQNFAVCGLVAYEHIKDKSADSALLVKGAVMLIKGDSLFETLMLNLHQYSKDNEEPFPVIKNDIPAWERESPTLPEDRHPLGYLDWLTWQSRRIKLCPEVIGGEALVKQVVIMKGTQLPEGSARYGKETMMAFMKREKTEGDPWMAISTREERAIWRDSLAIFASAEEKRARPKTLNWLNDLAIAGVLARTKIVPVDIFCLTTDKAKVEFWRHEQLPMSLRYLSDSALVSSVQSALDLAEQVGRLFSTGFDKINKIAHPRPMQIIFSYLYSPKDNAKADPDDVRSARQAFSPERAYWPCLEVPFKALLQALPEDKQVDEQGNTVYGGKSLSEWKDTLKRTAVQAFNKICEAVGTNSRGLKALAKAESLFNRRLHAILNDVGKEEPIEQQ